MIKNHKMDGYRCRAGLGGILGIWTGETERTRDSHDGRAAGHLISRNRGKHRFDRAGQGNVRIRAGDQCVRTF